MSFFQRAKTLTEVAEHILQGAEAGLEIKDFLHEFQASSSPAMWQQKPPTLAGLVENGLMLDAYFQALAVYLSAKLDLDPPQWTRPAIQLPDPWFASPGSAIRNYLLLSSPSPFRSRNLFIDEDSLIVV
jgi:hypothetical protein